MRIRDGREVKESITAGHDPTIAPPEPGSAEWFKVISASKVSAITGTSPWESAFSLWHRMAGNVPLDDSGNEEAKVRGQFLEQGVLEWWAAQHPEYTDIVSQLYLQRDGWAAATLDALARGEGVPTVAVEIKTASRGDAWGPAGTDMVPDYYRDQVDWQLLLCPEAEYAYVAVLLGPGLELREYVIDRDEQRISDLEFKAMLFHSSLAAGMEPKLDRSTATFTALKALHPLIEKEEDVQLDPELAERFILTKAAAEAAEAAATGAKSAVLKEMGNARRALVGEKVIARRQPNRGGVSLVAVAKATDFQGV